MKKKDIIFISIIIVLILIIIGILIYYNKSNSVLENTIEAEVLVVGSDYLLVTTHEEVDYVIDTKDVTYNVGDKLKLELKNINEEKSPIEATAKNITLLKKVKNNQNEVDDDQDEKVVPPEETNTNENTTSKETINSSTELEVKYTEEDVIDYFNDLDLELTNYSNDNSQTLGQTIKTNFVKCIDFIFYGGTIGGTTFNELTNTTKLKIIALTLSIDSKIDEVFPNYKDSISNTYQNIKNKLVEQYLDITTTICTNDEELCTNAKEGFKELKNSFGLTWNIIKELAGNGISKLKNWYEIWRYN